MATKTESVPNLVNVLRTARADLTAFFDRSIDFAEKRSKLLSKSVFKLARTFTKRLGGSAKRSK